jgi:3-deoxy-D-manno-octulosonic-acid transferase
VTQSDPIGLLTRVCLLATRAIPLLALPVLWRRLARGKEDPDRWREKLGVPGLPRPEGRLIWLHAVGLGEVMALRGLIAALADLAPDVEFLVTSSSRGSARVFGAALPDRCRHQFLPLDAPGYLARFLDHWRPDLSVWSEQDLWPGAVIATARRGIPLALVNARMNTDALKRRQRWRGLYVDLFARFGLIVAQDPESAAHMAALGATGVRVTGAFKAAAPPLTADPVALEQVRAALAGRLPLLLASSHAEDEAVALQALRQIAGDPRQALLLIAPRGQLRGAEIAEKAESLGLTTARRSAGQGPGGADVWIVDTLGEMGLWYRLCPVSLIGGTFGPTEGHNPWEPAALGSAILHGPRVANFAADYATLDAAGAARLVNADTLAAAFLSDLAPVAAKAQNLSCAAKGSLAPLAAELLALGGLA